MKAAYNFTVNKSLLIKSWSPDMERLSRLPAEHIIGTKLNVVYPLLSERVSAVISNGRKKSVKNFKSTCFMGTDMACTVHLHPVNDNAGKVRGVSVVFDQISGHCPLAKELLDSERMIAIGKIASSLAHGVRNPLNAIKGAVAYLREKYGHEATLLEFSSIINDEIHRLDSFISDFLSAAKGEMTFLPVNVNDIIKTIFVMIKPRTEIQNIKLTHSFSVLPFISADPFQIEQAVFNIINNAIEAMPEGGLLDIRTSTTWEKNTDYVVISISDTGKGISSNELKKLGQLSQNTEKNDRGFGVFISREIIKSHGGKLLWESVRDSGTTFKVFLPLKNEQ